jgi:hypothetical protein
LSHVPAFTKARQPRKLSGLEARGVEPLFRRDP